MRTWLAISVFIWGSLCGADEALKREKERETDPIRDAWTHEYLQTARRIDFTSTSNPPTKLALNESPLLKWHNPIRRGETHGDFFVWERDGVPVVVGTIFSYLTRGTDNNRILAIELHSLTTDRFTFTSPSFSGELNGQHVGEFDVVIPDGTVSENASRRLLQARNVARSCEAFTISDGVERRLRLLSQPLLSPRGAQDTTGKNQRALFAFVTGTDPELLILVRTVGEDGEKLRWRVTPARFTDLRIKVSVRGKEVWQWKPQSGSEPYFAKHGFAIKPADPR
jgi:hypothetical protein